jgi:RNA polymerase subunit RPABC4/transcription elongation factor Spt4
VGWTRKLQTKEEGMSINQCKKCGKFTSPYQDLCDRCEEEAENVALAQEEGRVCRECGEILEDDSLIAERDCDEKGPYSICVFCAEGEEDEYIEEEEDEDEDDEDPLI